MSEGRSLPLRVVAVACFLGAGALVAALGLVWARESAQPRIVLLGSGGSVSALVAAGDSRMLIASGSDPAAFAAALESARQPIQRRIDLLLAAGSGDELLVPAAVVADPHVRMAATLGRPGGQLDDGPLAHLPALTEPRQVTLNGDVSVRLEAMPRTERAGDESGEWAWRATVTRGSARVVVVSDGVAAALFAPPTATSLVVVSGPDPLAAISGTAGTSAPAFAFADRALSPREMRAAAGTVSAGWAIRVFDGEAIVVPFTADGLAIPPDAAVPLTLVAPATPGP